MEHPDNPLEDYPIRDTDLSRAFEKFKRALKEDEKLMKQVKDIFDPPKQIIYEPKKSGI